ncbi:MAG: peptidylprolyl isomerase [Rickettsiales bacterium]|nr:peptidylprolyl isomerase [Rickettsiales bacterium]
MKHSIKTSLIIIALTLSACQTSLNSKVSSKEESAANDPAKKVISTYSGGEVTLKDINIELEKLIVQNAKLKGLTFDKLNSDQKEAIIKEVVLKEMAYVEAKKRSLNKDKDYQEALKVFETELLKQRLFVDLAKQASDEKNVRKNYDELVAKLKDKKDLRISYIIVKTQNEAEAIYQTLLKYPNSFASQAKRKSLDKEVAKKGGDLGFVMEDALPAEIVKQAKSLNKGEIGKPVQATDKWAVIKLEDLRPAEVAPYEKAKDALAQSLAKKAIEDFLTQSLEKAKISVLVK